MRLNAKTPPCCREPSGGAPGEDRSTFPELPAFIHSHKRHIFHSFVLGGWGGVATMEGLCVENNGWIILRLIVSIFP